jgi:glycosyltransferase involved in cell wall biosynthesis
MSLISLCIPCHNRANDLAHTFPSLVRCINNSPPAEIAILDYNSSDDVAGLYREYMNKRLANGNVLSYLRYEGRSYYHMAHAWNLAVKASSGRYVVIMGADAVPEPGYLVEVRKLIALGAKWMRGPHYKGIICVARALFNYVGGFDERMEFYGCEDRDLEARLWRSKAQFSILQEGLVHTIKTPNAAKVAHYRLPLSKEEMSRRNHRVFEENNRNGTIIANEGREWGEWTH